MLPSNVPPQKPPTDLPKSASPSRMARATPLRTLGNPNHEAEAAFERELQAGEPVPPPSDAVLPQPAMPPSPALPLSPSTPNRFFVAERGRSTVDTDRVGSAPSDFGLATKRSTMSPELPVPSAGTRTQARAGSQSAVSIEAAEFDCATSSSVGLASRPDLTLSIAEPGSLVREIIVRRAADGGLEIVIRATNERSLRQLRTGAAQLKRIFNGERGGDVRFTLESPNASA